LDLILEKAGVAPDETIALVRYIRESCPHLEFIGLMTIGSASASHSAAEQQNNPDFEVHNGTVTSLTLDIDTDEGEVDEGNTRLELCRT